MKSVGFIGGYDKTEFILQIAKVLTLANRSVLVIDASVAQKARYVVPTISKEKSYVTEFEDIDVAIGFENIEDVKKYLGSLNYDIVLIDVESFDGIKNFKVEEDYKNCFVTGLDLYSLRKGFEILEAFSEPAKLTKVVFSKDFSKKQNEYLNYLALESKVNWEEDAFQFPIELGNYSIMIENQTISRLKMKKISPAYKSSLMYLMSHVFEQEFSESELKKIIKRMD